MKVSSVNSSGRALPDAAGADAVADATGVSAATEVAAEDTAGAEAAALDAAGVTAATEVAAAEERMAEAGAVGVAMTVPLEATEVAGAEPPDPAPQVATAPPGAL